MAVSEADRKLLEKAMKQFQVIEGYENDQRVLMEEDKDFSLNTNNSQWEEQDWKGRDATGRPFITVMLSNMFTDHVKNQQRQNKPSVKISPTDEGAQEKIATRRQGLVRHISYESKAQMARQQAFDDAVDMGRGHYVVRTEYVEGTMNQKIYIDPIKDSLAVYMDIEREKVDYSDCDHGFIINDMERTKFEEKYPKAYDSGWSSSSRDRKKWSSSDRVTVAEYFYRDMKKRKLVTIEETKDGVSGTRTLYEDEIKRKRYKIIKERWVEDPQWKWCLITSEEILEKKDLPWKVIPIVTVIGKESISRGRLSLKGLIRDIIQPCRMYNFLSSSEAELISLSPKTRYIAAEGQLESYEDEWGNSNRDTLSTLTYTPKTFEGQLVPPPQPIPFAGVPVGIVNQKQEIIEDIKRITGIYNSSVGQKSNETSGVAIRRREAQADNANYHYIQNYSHAITHEGRIINPALPIIYDTQRTITIMGEDDEEEMTEINGTDDIGLGDGNYNVTVSVGPSTNTQREEAAQGMLETLQQVPLIQNTAPDLVVRSQDWVGKDALADRLEFAVEKQIPGITTQVKPEEGDNDEVALLQQQLQQAQQQMQQMAQQAQELQQALQKSNADKNAAAAGKAQNDMEQLKIEWAKLKAEIEKGKAELALKEKELQVNGKIADLQTGAQVEIANEKNKAELIKVKVSTDSEIIKIDRLHENTEKSKEKESVNVKTEIKTETGNKMSEIKELIRESFEAVKPPTKKTTTVKKSGKGKYKFETKADNGTVTTGTVKESGEGYKVDSKLKDNDNREAST